MTRTPPRLVLMCGLPGAGKTTMARQLETEIPALRLCPDEWLADLGISLYNEVMRERLEAMFWQLAQRVLQLGQSVILENGFWGRAERDAKRIGAQALGARVVLHFLDVPLDELWRRIEIRNGEDRWRTAPITLAQLEEWAGLFQAPDAAEMALFDAPDELLALDRDGHRVPVLGGEDEDGIIRDRLATANVRVDGPSFMAELMKRA